MWNSEKKEYEDAILANKVIIIIVIIIINNIIVPSVRLNSYLHFL